jgi:hypothetical protein
MPVQLLHIKFRTLTHPAPQDGTSLMMHFQHVSFRLLARIAENALKNHCHIRHQIDGVIVHHHLPRHIDIFLGIRLFFNRRIRHRRALNFFSDRESDS